MTVVLRQSENFEKSGKMYFSSNTGYSEAEQQQQQRRCEESQSRVSFPPENGLSSESPLCRTMRPLGHHNHYQSENHLNNRLPSQKSSSNSSSSALSSSSSSSHFPSLLSSDNMFDKSIQKTIGMLSGSKIARLFGGSSGGAESSSQSHYYSKLALPSLRVPSSSSPPKSYHHHSSTTSHHHWASFGMVLIAIIILSTFSTSSVVLCVPLGGTGGSGVEEARRAVGAGLMMGMSPSKIMELHRKLRQNNHDNEEPHHQSQGEIYLPSLLSHGGGKTAVGVAEQTVEHSNPHRNTINPSNYHLKNQSHQPPIQKLHKKDVTRSVVENPGEDDDDVDDMGESEEINNRVDTMVAPPLVSSSTSTLHSLGRFRFGDGGGGGGNPEIGVEGDDDTNSSDDAMDQSPDGGSGQWETVIDPHLYVLTEWNRNPYQRRHPEQQYSMFRQQRKRRNSGSGPSLSIVNPLDVLRQRLLLEIARRRMRQSHNQIIANEEILRKIGRR